MDGQCEGAALASSIVLLTDSDDEEISQIQLNYQGSKPRYARVEVQGVPAHGGGADITIIGGDLFRQRENLGPMTSGPSPLMA